MKTSRPRLTFEELPLESAFHFSADLDWERANPNFTAPLFFKLSSDRYFRPASELGLKLQFKIPFLDIPVVPYTP